MQEKYQSIIKNREPDLQKAKRRENVLSWLKLASILCLVVPPCLAISIHIAFAASFVLVLIVIIAVSVMHNRLRGKVDYLEGIIEICNRHLDRINGKWTSFKDTGAEFSDGNAGYSVSRDGAMNFLKELSKTFKWG